MVTEEGTFMSLGKGAQVRRPSGMICLRARLRLECLPGVWVLIRCLDIRLESRVVTSSCCLVPKKTE